MNGWTNREARNRCGDIRGERVRAERRRVPGGAQNSVQQFAIEAEFADEFAKQ